MTLPLIEPRLRRNLDRLLLLSMLLLFGISMSTIYFASGSPKTAIRQGVYFTIGLLLMGYVAAQDYGKLARFGNLFYWGNVLLLLVVKLFVPKINGAARWIPLPIPGMDVKLQPSEFVKIVIILTLSVYVVRIGTRIREFPYLLRTLAHIALPVGLIMWQPDLGTGLVVVVIWAGIVFLAGADWRHMIGLAVAGLALFGIGWQTGLVKDYQKDRVITLLNPMHDPRGDGYHVLHSMRAIGGGQVTGQGFGKGVQTNGGFIPENHTDFVFTALGEEAGFVGACVLLTVYALFLWRGLAIMADSEDPLGRLIAGGVVTLFTFHILVNIGMTTGIMPVVGVPLPLVSFGGSAVWANLCAIGLLLSISMRRHKIQF
ncbi:MAG: rod shape-determining protein RodA [Capsulimonadales bacterium]|nr:rod shape-determining protein RodA [Capsulimonadales bacterium]